METRSSSSRKYYIFANIVSFLIVFLSLYFVVKYDLTSKVMGMGCLPITNTLVIGANGPIYIPNPIVEHCGNQFFDKEIHEDGSVFYYKKDDTSQNNPISKTEMESYVSFKNIIIKMFSFSDSDNNFILFLLLISGLIVFGCCNMMVRSLVLHKKILASFFFLLCLVIYYLVFNFILSSIGIRM